MKLSEKLKNYIREIVREESEEHVRNLHVVAEGQEALAEKVRNLNVQLDGYEMLVENVRNLNAATAGYEKLEENIRNLNATVAGYEKLEENIRNLNAATAGYEKLEENIRNLNAATAGYEKLEENIRNLNATVAGYEKLEENVKNLNATVVEQKAIAKNVRNLNDMLENYEEVVQKLKDISSRIETLSSTIEMQKVKLVMLEKGNDIQHNSPITLVSSVLQTDQETLPATKNVYEGIDYFDFENHFRGTREQIKRNQRQYIKYFQGKNNVIDLGCGRGEFLELLKENDIKAKGVDLYEEFAEMCRMHGLDVICDDALHFLSMQERIGGIFAGQLIEHLSVNQLVELCRLAYDKLEENACVIMETPNPTCLAIYSQAFYVDPSHNRPVHPLTVKYILEKSGFSDIEIIYTDTSRLPVCIPPIKGAENADQFNGVMHMVSELLFGSQDYAIIARKHGSKLLVS